MQPNKQLLASLQATAVKCDGLNAELANGVSVARATEINRELKKLEPISDMARKLFAMEREYNDLIKSHESESDPSMRSMLAGEIKRIDEEYSELVEQAKILLLPKDDNDDKNIIVEMRAGAGGDESSIFVGDLFQAYKKYSDSQGWRMHVTEAKVSAQGGFSTLSFEVTGESVYSKMKYESGVHRVQRVPATEAKGRVHTSTITVAVMPEMDELEVKIDPKDVRIDVMRASGAGGQSVNKTESAVRLTHNPSGIIVYSQEEKSQNENKDKAFKVLRAKLWEKAERERMEQVSSLRKSQIGTGDRSEKIRTYNYPQNRFTDHRIGLTINNLSAVMAGDLEPVIDAMNAASQKEMMESIAAG